MSNEVFEIPESSTSRLPVNLLYVTKAKYEKDWHSTNHTHHFTEILYITKGEGTFVFSNNEVPVKEHDLIIIHPNIEHTEKSTAGNPLEYIALGIEGTFSFPVDPGLQVTFYNFKHDQNRYLLFLQRLVEEVEKKKEDYVLIVHNLLEILLLEMRRKRTFTLEKASSQKVNKDIAFIQNYIKQHYRENINLDHLADAGHMNKYYLAHSFKKLVGISPIEYLIQTRIKESKILLETTNYSISNIAAMTGFSSQSFFAQSFKRVTNETPSQFRKAMAHKRSE